MLDAGHWRLKLNARHWMLDTRRIILDAKCCVLDIKCLTLDAIYRMLHAKC